MQSIYIPHQSFYIYSVIYSIHTFLSTLFIPCHPLYFYLLSILFLPFIHFILFLTFLSTLFIPCYALYLYFVMHCICAFYPLYLSLVNFLLYISLSPSLLSPYSLYLFLIIHFTYLYILFFLCYPPYLYLVNFI